jgi:putative aminopeptidase FrvX
MDVAIDTDAAIRFLVDLLRIPSVTGYHDEIVPFVRSAFEAIGLPGLSLRQNVRGALIATLTGESNTAPRALSAHLDTLGGMVREVKSNGRLMLTLLGGCPWQAVEGENLTIHCMRDGHRYRGTLQSVSPSTHANRPDMVEGKRDDERMEVRIDAPTKTRAETLALGVDVGDYVFFDTRTEVTDSGFIKSRFLDDKVGVAAVYGALRALKAAHQAAAQRTTILMCDYEEVGWGASTGVPADAVEMIAIDIAPAPANDHQNSDEFAVTICAKDASGPYDLALRRKLVRLAQPDIPYRIDTFPYANSDATAFLKAGGDVRTAWVGPGVDASHGYERTHRNALEATSKLLLRYLLDKEE